MEINKYYYRVWFDNIIKVVINLFVIYLFNKIDGYCIWNKNNILSFRKKKVINKCKVVKPFPKICNVMLFPLVLGKALQLPITLCWK